MSFQSNRRQAMSSGDDPPRSLSGDEPDPARASPAGSHAAEPPDHGRVDSVAPVPQPAHALESQRSIRRTRVSAIWVGLIVAAVLLIALLIFIGQNSRSVTIHYLGLDGHVPLAVALLASAVCGVLLVAVPGTARIIQLRRAVKQSPSAPPRPTDREWRP
jgi:uncharacterized integral membrane protein